MATVIALDARRAARERQRAFDAAVAAEMARRLADEERDREAQISTASGDLGPRLRVVPRPDHAGGQAS